MKIVWSRLAIRHLVALRKYIATDSEQNATVIALRILSTVELLQTQPEMGRPVRVPGTRELVVPIRHSSPPTVSGRGVWN